MFRALCLLFAIAVSCQALADPNPKPFENWKTDFSKNAVDLSEIVSGGPPKDGIPAIENPLFVELDVAVEKYADKEPVIVLAHHDDTRAYPLSVLTWHEIANDVIGGMPVTVTYCPLCNASIAFSRVVDGRTLDFGTTGRLRNSDLIMYDRQTETWWQQFTGTAIVGELTGSKLTMLPSTVMPFSQFRKRYPQGRVLVPENPSMRRYGSNPYAYYDSSNVPFLYRGEMPEGIDPMERVVIVETEKGAVIWTLNAIRIAGELELGDVKVSWQPGMASALDTPLIADGRDVGHLSATTNGRGVIHHQTFAFVAHAFHPEIEIER